MIPLISIITPVKNAATWLAECILSVQSQELEDWEWIFINDHSEDESAQILNQASEEDQRIKVYDANGKGILPALQQGLELCSGRYLTRMDADDIMPAGRLQLMLMELESSGPNSIVTGLSQYISDQPISDGYLKYQQWLNLNLVDGKVWSGIYRECVIASPNWLMRREELLAIGGFNDLLYPEDHDLCLRWYANGFKVKCIPEVTLHWREHPLRTSRNSDHYSQNSFFELKINRFLELDYRASKQLCLWGSGKKAHITGDILQRKKVDYTPMVLDQSDLKTSSGFVWYKNVEQLSELQILIAVYPPLSERLKIESYLGGLGLAEGTDFWFL